MTIIYTRSGMGNHAQLASAIRSSIEPSRIYALNPSSASIIPILNNLHSCSTYLIPTSQFLFNFSFYLGAYFCSYFKTNYHLADPNSFERHLLLFPSS